MYARTAELDGTGRSEDDYAFLRDEREFVNCLLVEQENGDFATTIVRQLLCSTYPARAVARARSHRPTSRSRPSPRRRSRRRRTTATTPSTGRSGSATAPRRATAAWRRRSRTLWPYTAELFEATTSRRDVVAMGVAADPALAPRRMGPVRRRRAARGDADTARRSPGRRPGAGEDCTPSVLGTCWLRCSTFIAPIRGWRGDQRRRASAGSPRACPTRSCPRSPSRISVSSATCASTTLGTIVVDITPTYSGCPAIEVDPRGRRAVRSATGVSTTSPCTSCCRPRGRPTG